MPREDVIQVLRGHAASWSNQNPVLLQGQQGLEVDTGKFKMGNGWSPWSELDYYIPEAQIREAIAEAIAAIPPSSDGGGSDLQALTAHINSPNPHPVYDDGPEFLLYYQNATV